MARVILFLVCMISGTVFSASLRPPELKISLKIDRKKVANNDIIPMQLTIQNVTSHRGNILIPYGQNSGKSLFQLRIYLIDSVNHYHLVFDSPIDLDMDTSKYRATDGFWMLDPGEQFTQPFFINDTKNHRKRIESSIALPKLSDGTYAVQFLYMPENSQFFKYAFLTDVQEDPILNDDVDVYPDHFRWEGTFVSNFVELEIDHLREMPLQPKHHHCALCKNITNENWAKVKHQWGRRKKNVNHPNLLWVYDGPQAVLSSLPTFFGFNVICQTKNGITYIGLNYQIGKIYRFRSRIAWIFHAIGFRKAPFKTSKVNWQKLITVKEL